MIKEQHLVISVMSRDRVGIVAGVAAAVARRKGNVDAMSQTVLRGYFTIILTASFPRPVDPRRLREEIAAAGEPGELDVAVKAWDQDADAQPVVSESDVFVLSIEGRDRPGVIAKITSFLASRNINIIDLYARSRENEFVFISQVMVPRAMDVVQLKIDLENLWKKSGLTVHFQHENIFIATQRVDFSGG